MRKLPLYVLAATLGSLATAGAQPVIPRNEMAGRERFRFIESPAERFMKPGPYVAPYVVDVPPQPAKRRARHSSKKHR